MPLYIYIYILFTISNLKPIKLFLPHSLPTSESTKQVNSTSFILMPIGSINYAYIMPYNAYIMHYKLCLYNAYIINYAYIMPIGSINYRLNKLLFTYRLNKLCADTKESTLTLTCRMHV